MRLLSNLSVAIAKGNAAMATGLARKHGGFARSSLLDPGMLSKRGGAALWNLHKYVPFEGQPGEAVEAVTSEITSDNERCVSQASLSDSDDLMGAE